MAAFNIISEYTLAQFIGIVCLVLIILLGFKPFKDRIFYSGIFWFGINIVAISFMLYVMYIYEAVLHIASVILPFRVLDYGLYAALLYTWISMIEALHQEVRPDASNKIYLLGKVTALAGAGIFMVITVKFMDNNYYIADPEFRRFYHLSEIIFAVAASLIVSYSMFHTLDIIANKDLKRYICFTALLLILYFLMQIVLTASLGEPTAPWSINIDYSGWLFVIMELLTCVYLYRENFRKPQTTLTVESTEIPELQASAVDIFQKEYNLTSRERDVVELVYQGCSNKEIAERLCISTNTVKCHVHNAFEKSGADTRIELVHLINECRK